LTSGAGKILKRHFFTCTHPGRLASQWRVSSRYVWRGLAKDVAAWAKTCLHCQQSKHRHARTQLLHIPVPQWHISHIDLVGPLQYSNNCNYIFTIIDRISKWMEAVPLSAISIADCAQALVFHWITYFGVPDTITSDRWLHFTSNL
jgi:cleavage and polyadenylation specificity factor subunit 1